MIVVTYFYPLQIDRVHNGALKEFHSGKVSLEQAFELQVGRFPVINAQLTLGRDSPPPAEGRSYHALYLPKYAVVWWNGGASARPEARPSHREKQ